MVFVDAEEGRWVSSKKSPSYSRVAFKIQYTKPALADFKEIIEWSWRNHEVRPSAQFGRALLNHIEVFRRVPRLGVPLEEHAGRSQNSAFAVFTFIIGSGKTKQVIEILHFWHSKRQPPHFCIVAFALSYNGHFMKRLRGLLVADPLIVLSTIFCGSISLIVSLFDSTGAAQIRVARAWARSLLRVSGVKVRVEGLEHISPNGSYVFIANHMSYMDTPVVLAHVPAQFRFLAKRGLFKIPFLGQHLSRAGHIPVPRGDPRAAVKTLQKAAETIQEKKISLLVFPEGGRSHDGAMREFKEGGAYIAIRAGVPLVPLTLAGTREVLPYGSGIVKSGKVTLRISKPIETSAMNLKDRGPVTEQLRKIISGED